MKLNKHGVNAQITYNKLPDKTMRSLGFTDYRKGNWYKCIILQEGYEITFNMSIPKAGDGNDIQIDVLDDQFCQPYDYQYMLSKNPENERCNKIKSKVEAIMEELQEAGLINGFEKGMYI